MLFAFWNLISAAFVARPNVVVSFPAEPGPLAATVKPCAFRYFCNARTSLPTEPTVKLRVKVVLTLDELALVPVKAACTFAIVALSAPNDSSRARIEVICELDNPEDEVAGAVVVVVGAVVVVVGVVVTLEPTLPLELEEEPPDEVTPLPPDEDGAPAEQSELDGVIVTVRSAVPEYAISESEALQLLFKMSASVFVSSAFRPGAVTSIKDPSSSVKLKDEAFTVMVATVAGEPEMSTMMPPTLSATFVSKLTTLFAVANARVGDINAATEEPLIIFS